MMRGVKVSEGAISLSLLQAMIAGRHQHNFDIAVREFLYTPVLVDSFLLTFETGYRLAPDRVLQLMALPTVAAGVSRLWYGDISFNDDVGFSPERFLCVTKRWDDAGAHQTPSRLWRQAETQLVRMYLTGRADNRYTAAFKSARNLREKVNPALLAHDTAAYNAVVTELDWVKTYPREAENVAIIDSLTEILAIASRQRDMLFRGVWLPATLSGAEAARVKKLSLPLLRDMYPRQWATGYDAYRTVINPTVIPVGTDF